jgi:hypothetical protein
MKIEIITILERTDYLKENVIHWHKSCDRKKPSVKAHLAAIVNEPHLAEHHCSALLCAEHR